MITNQTSSFLTIPHEEIKRFLALHHLSASENEEYLVAWEYLQTHPESAKSSVYLEDFILAYNHQEITIERRTTSSILLSQERELRFLATSLDLSRVDKARIIRILSYLDLVNNDMSVFDLLPNDTLKLIGYQLDCQTLSLWCQLSQVFYQKLCQTGEIQEMLKIKLAEETGLNVSHYTKDQLALLCHRINHRVQLAGGAEHSLFLDSQGRAYSCGYSSMGQLGLGEGNQERLTPTQLDPTNLETIVAIAAGSYHSLFLNSQGQVFSCGINDDGELGLSGARRQFTPTLITQPMGHVIKIAAGFQHSLFLNDQGQLFGCGLNDRGQLGINKEMDLPTLIDLSQFGSIKTIAAGGFYSLLLNEGGQVILLGHNIEENEDEDLFPSPIMLDTSAIGPVVVVAAGSYAALLLSSEGKVFQVNFDNYDLEEPDYGLIIVPILGLSNIITMSVGNQHALFLDADGQVYGMGPDIINPHDVLDNENVSPFLLEIPGDHPIIMIASGIEHSFVMDSSGHVYGFGYNHFGQLGTGDEKIHRFPTLIKDFRL